MQSIERMKNSVYLRAKIQNDYLQASHITAIFTCYWAYNAYFKLQKERHVTEIEQAAQYSWRCQLQTFFP